METARRGKKAKEMIFGKPDSPGARLLRSTYYLFNFQPREKKGGKTKDVLVLKVVKNKSKRKGAKWVFMNNY